MSWSFDPDVFEDRLKLQKYTYLSKFYGYNHDYDFSMYVHGPYAPELTEHYYEDELRSWGEDVPPPEIDFDQFIEEVGVKSEEWLEAAATIISVHQDHKGFFEGEEVKGRVVKRVTRIKDDISKEYISQVYDELDNLNLL